MVDQRASERLPLARDGAELAALMEDSYAELPAAIAGLGARRMTAVEDAGGWTVKDHLGHVVAWEQILLDRLAGQAEHEAAGVSEDSFAAFTSDGTADPTDALNEMIFQRWQYVPLDEVLDSFTRSHEEVLRVIDALSDAELLAPLDPGAAVTRIRRIAEYGYWHYADHAAWIRRFA